MFSDFLLLNHRPTDPAFQDIMNIKQNANRAAGLVRQLQRLFEHLEALAQRWHGEAPGARLGLVPGRPDAEDPVERFSCRPDFLILCYPVIMLGQDATHRGSQRNLLGGDADPALDRKSVV